MKELPSWMQDFNNRKLVDSLYSLNWNLKEPKEVYDQYCDTNDNAYKSKPFGKDALTIPYTLDHFAGKDYSRITITPFANNLLGELAKAAIQS